MFTVGKLSTRATDFFLYTWRNAHMQIFIFVRPFQHCLREPSRMHPLHQTNNDQIMRMKLLPALSFNFELPECDGSVVTHYQTKRGFHMPTVIVLAV